MTDQEREQLAELGRRMAATADELDAFSALLRQAVDRIFPATAIDDYPPSG